MSVTEYGWWNRVPPVSKTDQQIKKVLGQHSIVRQCFVYPFVTEYDKSGVGIFHKLYSVAIDADSDFECRELYVCKTTPGNGTINWQLTYYDESQTSRFSIDNSAYETRERAGANEPVDLSYPFPSGSHADLLIEFVPTSLTVTWHVAIIAWMKGFKVFK
jgi:hypothetical protein